MGNAQCAPSATSGLVLVSLEFSSGGSGSSKVFEASYSHGLWRLDERELALALVTLLTAMTDWCRSLLSRTPTCPLSALLRMMRALDRTVRATKGIDLWSPDSPKWSQWMGQRRSRKRPKSLLQPWQKRGIECGQHLIRKARIR